MDIATTRPKRPMGRLGEKIKIVYGFISGGESSIFVYSTSSISLYPPVTDFFPKVSMVTLTRPAQTPAVPRRGVLSTPGTRPQTRPGSRYSVSVDNYSSASQTRARPGGK